MLNKMAVVSYCLVGVLLLTALVSGQGDLLASEPQLELLNGKVKIVTDVFRPLVDSMTKNPFLCTACENFVQFLRNAADNQQLLAELVTLILPVCDWLPSAMHEECLGAVRKMPTLLKMYTYVYLDPKTDCALLCAASRMANAPNLVPLTVNDLVQMMNKKPAKQ
ncbi:uncharacterized protein LOC119732078 isoform X1 [Patiria miniata]|uniref:Saposin B-type domain-containing protein n=1 Tax=Patiria miniata TaxID=46514 RepID=A0A914AD33_PATMI|nr:uncharacterized protein LOC119732078 isoform X1 [Patiria miniata]